MSRLQTNAVLSSAVVAFQLLCAASAGDGSGCVPPNGCTEGCADSSSAFDVDLPALFHSVAGDELLLRELRNRKACGLTYSVGGELRYRYMDEKNRLRPPGVGQSQYDLWRFTPFVSVGNDFVTGYVQAIDASLFELDAPYTPVAIDENRSDLVQYYVDLKLLDTDEGSLTYRYGRQFLLYGGQRLLSPLAWSNTFRNFEGHKLMATSGDWKVDAFAVQRVNGASGNTYRPTSFDSPDQSHWLMGVYSTWSGIPDNAVDLYYLYYDQRESLPTAIDGTRHTIGMRVAGRHAVQECSSHGGSWSWDLEGACQFGEDNLGTAAFRDVRAGMLGALGGYTFENIPLKPGVGGIFYWASGDDASTTGDINTFYSLYPLGHAYWGQIDNFGGMNLLDYGIQATLQPHQKVSLVTQWHWFELADSGGSIINIAGASLPGSGDRHIGNELDIVGTVNVSETLNLQAGYFWFFYGDAVLNGPLARADADQFYLQATWKY